MSQRLKVRDAEPTDIMWPAPLDGIDLNLGCWDAAWASEQRQNPRYPRRHPDLAIGQLRVCPDLKRAEPAENRRAVFVPAHLLGECRFQAPQKLAQLRTLHPDAAGHFCDRQLRSDGCRCSAHYAAIVMPTCEENA